MCMDTIYRDNPMFLAVSIIIIVCMGVWNINVLECIGICMCSCYGPLRTFLESDLETRLHCIAA